MSADKEIRDERRALSARPPVIAPVVTCTIGAFLIEGVEGDPGGAENAFDRFRVAQRSAHLGPDDGTDHERSAASRILESGQGGWTLFGIVEDDVEEYGAIDRRDQRPSSSGS